MKLAVVKVDDGAALSFGSMLLRETIGKLVSVSVLLLGLIWIFIDTNNQSWHDKITSSVVVSSEE